jgi:hypothetical protein
MLSRRHFVWLNLILLNLWHRGLVLDSFELFAKSSSTQNVPQNELELLTNYTLVVVTVRNNAHRGSKNYFLNKLNQNFFKKLLTLR